MKPNGNRSPLEEGLDRGCQRQGVGSALFLPGGEMGAPGTGPPPRADGEGACRGIHPNQAASQSSQQHGLQGEAGPDLTTAPSLPAVSRGKAASLVCVVICGVVL